MRFPKTCIATASLAALGGLAQAQTPSPESRLEPVVISVSRSEQRAFDAPAAVNAVDGETIREAGLQVNLSEVMNRVPGIAVLNRQNYSQDLQLSIRGFGSRSTFGIRGVRLIVDGIPATMPDGQGQASNIALSSAERIEVLRGPMALLYGNAAGGVVQVFSEVGADRPTMTWSGSAATYGTWKGGVKLANTIGDHKYTLDASQFHTDGYRQHSAADRGQINARWRWQIAPGTRLDVVGNLLDQPDSEDPLGLTRPQWQQNPKQAVALAFTQDAGKTVRQNQLGAVLDHKLGDDTTLTGRVYGGTRDLDNKLSIPPGTPAQTAVTGSGAMVVFERLYSGVGLQVAHRFRLGEGAPVRVVVGVDRDGMKEDRQGYQNLGGVQGDLKRNEYNKVSNKDFYAQASFDPADAWTVTAGVRRSRIEFETIDRFFILPANPDDSGTRSYSATSPALGVSWRASPGLNLYANLGRGFETPTFAELSYRPNNLTGLNLALNASRSRQIEAGMKWRLSETQRLDLALFSATATDEIVTDTNIGGRTTFANAGKTSRRGLEAAWSALLPSDFRAATSLTLLRAKFASNAQTSTRFIPAGNKLPGVPQANGFAELAWEPRNAGGFSVGLEAVHQGRIYVDDANSDSAPGATVAHLRFGLQQQLDGGLTLREGLRIENLTDRRYAGSVIVNDGNSRFFEPAPGRTASFWLTAQIKL